jgi:hypothetical protein
MVVKIKVLPLHYFNGSGLNTALMTPELLPSHFQIIGRYSPPFAFHTPTLRVPFPLPLERERYAKGTRNVGET